LIIFSLGYEPIHAKKPPTIKKSSFTWKYIGNGRMPFTF
jgi:hypothetical protein